MTILRSEIQTAKAVGSAGLEERVTRRKAHKHERVCNPLLHWLHAMSSISMMGYGTPSSILRTSISVNYLLLCTLYLRLLVNQCANSRLAHD